MKRARRLLLIVVGMTLIAAVAAARRRPVVLALPAPLPCAPLSALPEAAPDAAAISPDESTVAIAAAGFDARFEATGLQLDRPGHAPIRWGWAQVDGLATGPEKPLVRDGIHVYRDAGPIREHWEQRPEGIEHSITIAEPPGEPARSPQRSGEFTVRMPIEGGLQPALQDGNIALLDAEGNVVMAYENVKAFDARGIPVPARMDAVDGAVEIRVRYLDAVYPILIDPLITVTTRAAVEPGDVLQRYQGHGSYPGMVVMRVCYANAWNWKRVYIDVDRNPATGFRYRGLGADLLIENNSVFGYAGTGGNWAWTYIAAPDGFNEMPADGTNATSWYLFTMWFHEGTPPWSDGAVTLLFEIERPGAELTSLPFNYRHSGDHHYGPRGYFAENDGARAYYHFDGGMDVFNYRHVYIDTDRNPATGFPILSNVGANFLLENGTLYRYTGSGGSWSWAVAGDGHLTMDANTSSWWVDRSVLGLTNGSSDSEMVAYGGQNSQGIYGVEPALHEFSAVIRPAAAGGGWTRVSSGTTANLNGVFFADAGNGWAVGQGGTILRTTNGGATWVRQTSNTTNWLWRVQFVSATRGWVVGDGGTILSTSDGGATWTVQPTPTGQSLRGLSFVSSTTGWVVGTSGRILKTTNGGATWTRLEANVTNTLYGVSFAHTLKGWIAGDGIVLSTSDGGATWSSQPASGLTLRDAKFLSESKGFMVGGSTAGAVIRSTTNGGATWTATVRDASPKHFRAIAFGTSANLWAAGSSGILAASLDGGVTWSSQTSTTTAGLNGVWFVNATTGWAVGDGGVVLKTTTGGR